MLSAQVHGDAPGGHEVVLAALRALAGVSDDRATLYLDWIHAGLGEPARTLLEAEMEAHKHEYRSDFARRYFAEGRVEGRVEGEAVGEIRGRIQALLCVLSARGLDPDEGARRRILECRDPATLDRWTARAATASSLVDVLREGPG